MTQPTGRLDPEQLAAVTAGQVPEAERRDAAPWFRALLSILAEGRPASVEEVATISGKPSDRLAADLSGDSDVEWDAEGRVIGVGITLTPTPHRVEVNGNTLYAWCAADALGMLPAVGRSVRITSACHATGQPVTVRVGPGGVQEIDPQAAVVSVIAAGDRNEPRATMCSLGHFFVSAEAASEWHSQHPDGALLSVPDAFRYAYRVMQFLLRPDTPLS